MLIIRPLWVNSAVDKKPFCYARQRSAHVYFHPTHVEMVSLLSHFYWFVKFVNVGIPNTLPLSPNRPVPPSASSSNTTRRDKGPKKSAEEEKYDADIDIGRPVHTL